MFKNFLDKETNKGRQNFNLDAQIAKGLKSVSDRIKEGELIVVETDKSGKMLPCDAESYIKMGEVHTSKDQEVNMDTVKEKAADHDSHVSTWIKILSIGSNNKHSHRFRESYMGGDTPCPLTVLAKDHKNRNADETMKTRPVVSGCSSYNRGLSEILSELLEAVLKDIKGGVTVISSDDLLSRLHKLNSVIKEKELVIYDPENPEHVHGDTPTITMLASDVSALFPSMNKEETARVCAVMIEKSDLMIEEVDYTEILLYLRMNQNKVDLGDLENLLPVRRYKGGNAPGMKNSQIKGPHKQTEIPKEKLLWHHKDIPLSKESKKRILAKAVEVAIITLFSGFIYTFNGKLYLQQDGAPIGTRIACACALLMMEWFWEEVGRIVKASDPDTGAVIHERGNYVDDART